MRLIIQKQWEKRQDTENRKNGRLLKGPGRGGDQPLLRYRRARSGGEKRRKWGWGATKWSPEMALRIGLGKKKNRLGLWAQKDTGENPS